MYLFPLGYYCAYFLILYVIAESIITQAYKSQQA